MFWGATVPPLEFGKPAHWNRNPRCARVPRPGCWNSFFFAVKNPTCSYINGKSAWGYPHGYGRAEQVFNFLSPPFFVVNFLIFFHTIRNKKSEPSEEAMLKRCYKAASQKNALEIE